MDRTTLLLLIGAGVLVYMASRPAVATVPGARGVNGGVRRMGGAVPLPPRQALPPVTGQQPDVAAQLGIAALANADKIGSGLASLWEAIAGGSADAATDDDEDFQFNASDFDVSW